MLSSSDHILILGGTGLFGHHLLPRLLLQHNVSSDFPRISLVTRSASNAVKSFPYLKSFANIIECDFLHCNRLEMVTDCTHILHMATTSARDTYSGVNQFSKFELLLNSAYAVRDIILRGGVKKVVFASSGVAYGSPARYIESTPSVVSHLQLSSSLMLGKITAEFILYDACITSQVHYSIARLFSFVSPFLPCDIHYAIGNFVRDAIQNKDIVIRSDGKDMRSYQHLEDAIDWILSLVLLDRAPLVLNIGSDESLSIRDLALRVKYLTNSSSAIRILNNNVSDDNARRSNYIPDISLARSLGLENTISLNDSIVELARFVSANA